MRNYRNHLWVITSAIVLFVSLGAVLVLSVTDAPKAKTGTTNRQIRLLPVKEWGFRKNVGYSLMTNGCFTEERTVIGSIEIFRKY